jgi:hypothetical protein
MYKRLTICSTLPSTFIILPSLDDSAYPRQPSYHTLRNSLPVLVAKCHTDLNRIDNMTPQPASIIIDCKSQGHLEDIIASNKKVVVLFYSYSMP